MNMDERINLRKTEPDINDDVIDILDSRSEMDLSHYKDTYSVLIRRMTAIGPESGICRELNEIVKDRRATYDRINREMSTAIIMLKNNIGLTVMDLQSMILSNGTHPDSADSDSHELDKILMSMDNTPIGDQALTDVILDGAESIRNIESKYDPKHSTSIRYGLDEQSLRLDFTRKNKAKESFIEALSDLDRMKALHNGYVKGATIMISLNGLKPAINGKRPQSIVDVQANGNDYDVLGADKGGSRFLIAIHNKERTYEYYSIVNTDGEMIRVMTTDSTAPVELTWNSLFFGFLSLR